MIQANKKYEGIIQDPIQVGLDRVGKNADRTLRLYGSKGESDSECGNPVTNVYSWDRSEGLSSLDKSEGPSSWDRSEGLYRQTNFQD
jgi:hypothetical protein